MSFFAYSSLILAFLCATGGFFAALFFGFKTKGQGAQASTSPFFKSVEYASLFVTFCLIFSSAVLMQALVLDDFSLVYVANYSDRFLPLVYKITAFWAGQPGSLLFWALSVGLMAFGFYLTSSYKELPSSAKTWYLAIYLAIMAFFLLLLLVWNNPFIVYDRAPFDGKGLNPLLQNFGMIVHPPLLFLGYGAFIIPSCLALAQGICLAAHEEKSWPQLSRPFMLIGWSLLTAGIVLGAWWAYMELGWGGYWAWDPVENASLIPWLVATACLHATIVQIRRNKLQATSIFLVALTSISTFFATYLVRSGVVQSVHSFGVGSVGTPLLIFIALSLVVSLIVSFRVKKSQKELDGLLSREGFVVLTVWILLAIGLLIFVATLWPVFSSLWQGIAQKTQVGSVGLGPAFYNRVCLPIFALLMAVLALCPWLSWAGGFRSLRKAAFVLLLSLASGMTMYSFGYRLPISVLTVSSAVACILTVFLMWADGRIRARLDVFSAHGIHLGVALIALGIAFSGPYKQETTLLLARQESQEFQGYTIVLNELYEGVGPGFHMIESELLVSKEGEFVGQLAPQRRLYDKWPGMAFAESAALPSLGQEVYATLLGIDEEYKASVRISLNPLVNWLWFGGVLMCIFPLVSLFYRKKALKD